MNEHNKKNALYNSHIELGAYEVGRQVWGIFLNPSLKVKNFNFL
jgi:hypothetical protein